ncbi:MAG: T9SS type A sorting domain-containing protein, partial [Calditrichaeota bacterium]|nr:T9SS type A sorting domain-containing protein [Calditrichota bacterium]
DRIIAYNTSGSIVGDGDVLNGQCGLAVWGDDPTTDVVDGLTLGELFTLSVWDLKNNASSELEVIQIRTGTSLNYESNGFVVLDLTASNAIPDEYYLAQNYPNPFNSMTSCKFGLPEAGKLTIAVFDISGRLVTTLVDTEMPAGTHSIRWNASSTAAGMYFIQMAASGFETTRKVTLLK